MKDRGDRGEDLRAIERLHERDMAASRAGDFRTLRGLVSDDAVAPAARRALAPRARGARRELRADGRLDG